MAAVALDTSAGARSAYAAAGDIYNLGGVESHGYDINDAGQVAGVTYPIDANTPRAFRHDGVPGSGGAMKDLGTLEGGSVSFGQALNGAGQATGFASNAEGHDRAFRYTGIPGSGGKMVELGTLGGTNSFGIAINASSQIVGDADLPGGQGRHAFLYTGTPGTGGTMSNLGTLGGSGSSAKAINDAGQIAGTAWTANGATHAFLYSGTPGAGGVMVDLGTLGGKHSGIGGINSSGQMTGDSYIDDAIGNDVKFHAIRYTGTPGAGGAMVDIGTLGGWYSAGRDINDAGFIVGFSSNAAGAQRATFWKNDAANSIVDLDAWLDATNPALGAHWTLRVASGINNNGFITGQGVYSDGPGGLSDGDRAFLLDASSLVPEPGILALVAVTLPALLGRRQRFEKPFVK